MSEPKAFIEQVLPGSIAEEIGIEKGDYLAAINGCRPKDFIDYRFLCADDNLELEVLKANGEVWECEIEKEYDEDLGLVFQQDTFDGIRNCANKCMFCFVDQMPANLRDSLYVKDDDYRMSFLHGNFVTLTNLTEADLQRIIQMRLSPLYISVHCTSPELRQRMLGNKKAKDIMAQMTLLAESGIEMHGQIVLCPGINDGPELERTITDLAGLWPQVKSIAIVPVGMTGFRENLPELSRFSRKAAAKLIDRVQQYQQAFMVRLGSPLIFLADEFFVIAGQDFPQAAYYGDYPQLENGVGLVRLFYDSFDREFSRLPQCLPKPLSMAVLTGISGQQVLQPIIDKLNKIGNLQVELIGVDNHFFGGQVSVAGLVTGSDIKRTMQSLPHFDLILLPSVMFKRDEPVFLDGLTLSELERQSNTLIKVVHLEAEAKEFIDIILE